MDTENTDSWFTIKWMFRIVIFLMFLYGVMVIGEKGEPTARLNNLFTSEDNPDIICKPGLTGLGRIQKLSGDSDDHQHFDHYYVQNQNITLDIEIMLKTVLSL